MENLKNVLKKRLFLMVGFNVLVTVFIVLTGAYSNMTASSNENMTDMIHGFQVGNSVISEKNKCGAVLIIIL